MEAGDGDLKRRLIQLSDTWLDRAEQFEQHACPGIAATYRQAAEELQSIDSDWENELLTIADAAQETGYSEDHLRRLVREGQLPAERADGKKSQIRLRRSDLPRKRAHPQNQRTKGERDSTYDPEEDARSIAKRLGR